MKRYELMSKEEILQAVKLLDICKNSIDGCRDCPVGLANCRAILTGYGESENEPRDANSCLKMFLSWLEEEPKPRVSSINTNEELEEAMGDFIAFCGYRSNYDTCPSSCELFGYNREEHIMNCRCFYEFLKMPILKKEE